MSSRRLFLSLVMCCVGGFCLSLSAAPLKLPAPGRSITASGLSNYHVASSSTPSVASPIEGNQVLFNRREYDTPKVNAATFSRQHDLNNAPAFAKALCQLPDYQCVDVLPGDTWVKLFPDPAERSMIMRLNRMNVALKYRSWILVPRHWSQLDFMMFSPLPVQINPDGHRHLVIDLKKFAFGAYNKQGQLIHWGPARGGSMKCPLSNKSCQSVLGHYKIYRMKGADCYSRTYPLIAKGGAPMPYCMFYYKGYAIHASTLSGFFNHSRGCIRLFYDDAKWLNQDFVKIGTQVTVS